MKIYRGEDVSDREWDLLDGISWELAGRPITFDQLLGSVSIGLGQDLEERASILEYDGGLPRWKAEAAILDRYRLRVAI